MKRFTVIVVLLGALATGCTSDMLDVDIDGFSPLPALEELDYSRIVPAGPFEYWEVRWIMSNGGDNRILGAGGTRTREELDSMTVAELDKAAPPAGLSAGCPPAFCYTFVATVNNTVNVIADRPGLLQFLGSIDSVEEAALVAHTYNLHWDAANRATGFRAVSEGWEILGLQLVRDCTPVQTDRVHVLVRRDGALTELGREIYSRLKNACV